MQALIDKYFETHLQLTSEDAKQLHARYYKDYGLALDGLIRHHKIDPMDYNQKVDDALPLVSSRPSNSSMNRGVLMVIEVT